MKTTTVGVLLLCLFSAARSALGLDQTKLPQGTDHAAAHAQATGKNIKVGVVEAGDQKPRGINTTKYHFAGRLANDYDLNGLTAPLNAAPPANTGAADHGTLVSDIIASDDATYTGVAKEAKIYAATFEGANIGEMFDAFCAGVDWMNRSDGVNIFNHSTGNVELDWAKFLDWHATSAYPTGVGTQTKDRDALHIVAAGNNDNDGFTFVKDIALNFNGLTVGAVDETFKRVAKYSNRFPTPDDRAKPDLVAPGGSSPVTVKDGIDNDADNSPKHIELAGTSFATPHVTGVAAMLAEKGLTMGTGDSRNRLAQRAIIMNSTRKRFINVPDKHDTDIRDETDFANGSNDGNYLDGAVIRANSSSVAATALPLKAGRTDEWTPKEWSTNAAGRLTVTKPLDDEMGTGMLDAKRALIQLAGGEQEEKGENPAGVGPIGYNKESLSPDGAPDIYEFNFPIVAGSFITATLAWERPVIEHNVTPELINGIVNPSDTYTYGALPNFDLFIYKGTEIWAESIGTLDTVEHLHFPVPSDGNAFDYSLRVDLLGAGTVPLNYALAWWTVPEPGCVTMTLFSLAYVALRRRRPFWGSAAS
jgi:subtilisin family serine protease